MFEVLTNRKDIVRYIDEMPEPSEWTITQEQFIRRFELLEGLRDLAGVVIKNEVTDILVTNGGEAGRFKW